ncbi:hydroxyethylthiazole kinase [Bacillus ectoiniformans]|uniref:hydroxyethylthiazole kinase n=1 Tax=Bacillus ectoiniformans TaxID=1494429 RepID=UPI00195B5DA1|nr:hydroxyethylthiazole kinase [Bacillus ectoiniformans]MBM7647374.1 hydroxyethylthiazole kinase [Bacillus ectoiniformans]
MDVSAVSQTFSKVREGNPLIHNITNIVVANFTANGLLAIGASPIMADAVEEVADMAKVADALVLNMGTIDETKVKAMIIAGQSANRHGVPVIFDPVGAGATPYRTEMAKKILREVKVSLMRSNAAEAANATGRHWAIKGVDSVQGQGDPQQLAETVAREFGILTVISGETDIITDGSRTCLVENGHPLLTKVTGGGCLLTSVIGAFLAVESDYFTAAYSAVSAYGAAAEKAVEIVGSEKPGSFQIEFINQLALVSANDLTKRARFNVIHTKDSENDTI